MEKKKEQAKVLSQEMLADGIYSLWIETEAARTARPGTVCICIHGRCKQITSAVRSVSVKLIKREKN